MPVKRRSRAGKVGRSKSTGQFTGSRRATNLNPKVPMSAKLRQAKIDRDRIAAAKAKRAARPKPKRKRRKR